MCFAFSWWNCFFSLFFTNIYIKIYFFLKFIYEIIIKSKVWIKKKIDSIIRIIVQWVYFLLSYWDKFEGICVIYIEKMWDRKKKIKYKKI